MWIIELNVAGHQFTHRVGGPRGGLRAFRLDRQALSRIVPQLRGSQAA